MHVEESLSRLYAAALLFLPRRSDPDNPHNAAFLLRHVVLPPGAKEVRMGGASVSSLPSGGLAVESGSYEFTWTE